MKTYRILASYTSYCYMDVEAENREEAREIAYNADGGDFKDEGLGNWNIDEITLKEEPYTCPKFEPAQEES